MANETFEVLKDIITTLKTKKNISDSNMVRLKARFFNVTQDKVKPRADIFFRL
jgi:hypothetical protein